MNDRYSKLSHVIVTLYPSRLCINKHKTPKSFSKIGIRGFPTTGYLCKEIMDKGYFGGNIKGYDIFITDIPGYRVEKLLTDFATEYNGILEMKGEIIGMWDVLIAPPPAPQ